MSQPLAHCLLADIGGTHIRFAVWTPADGPKLNLASVRQRRMAELDSVEAAAAAYLQEQGCSASHAVFAAAGPVVDGEVELTNHGRLRLSAQAIRQSLKLVDAQLINDFAAVALSLPWTAPERQVWLSGGDLQAAGPAPAAAAGIRCVLGPGTGLGVAALSQDTEGRATVLQTEGGHIAFSPQDELEQGIQACLQRRFGRVSNERLISGPGLASIHQALAELDGERDPPLLSPSEVSRGLDARSRQAVDVFCKILGSVAGDAALAYGAWQGVYLSGGWLGGVLNRLRQNDLVQRFQAKGRFSAAMRRVPLALLDHPQPGLLGAAAQAQKLLRHHGACA